MTVQATHDCSKQDHAKITVYCQVSAETELKNGERQLFLLGVQIFKIIKKDVLSILPVRTVKGHFSELLSIFIPY